MHMHTVLAVTFQMNLGQQVAPIFLSQFGLKSCILSRQYKTCTDTTHFFSISFPEQFWTYSACEVTSSLLDTLIDHLTYLPPHQVLELVLVLSSFRTLNDCKV